MKIYNAVQLTFDDFLKRRMFSKAKQEYLNLIVYTDNRSIRARQTSPCWYQEDYNEKANREYYIYLGMEKLLKQIARHRKIKGFKPWPYEIYAVISGKTDYEDLLNGETVRFHEQFAA